jgi:hypothetical protein
LPLEAERSDLSPGVNAGVGASGEPDSDALAGERAERRLELVLDGASVRL